MHRHRSIRLVAFVIALAGAGCWPPRTADVRCTRRPAREDYGTCMAILGSYYDPRTGECREVSGCTCDATCRQEEIPFQRREDCEAACAVR